MSYTQPTTIHLPVFKDDSTSAGYEELPVEILGAATYRLICSPGFVYGLAGGDEFLLAPDTPLGYTIVRRAGNVCVWFFFAERQHEHAPALQQLRARVETLGGHLDGGSGRMVIFTLPVTVGFPTIEQIFEQAVQQHSGATWMYSNVYDPGDGQTPLNWW